MQVANLVSKKSKRIKGTRMDQFTFREAITGSNKGIGVHSTKAISGTLLPFAVHLFSLLHKIKRERIKKKRGGVEEAVRRVRGVSQGAYSAL